MPGMHKALSSILAPHGQPSTPGAILGAPSSTKKATWLCKE